MSNNERALRTNFLSGAWPPAMGCRAAARSFVSYLLHYAQQCLAKETQEGKTTMKIRKPKTVYALFKQDAKRWIQHALARTSQRKNALVVAPRSKEAGCFCLLGAIDKVYGEFSASARIAKEKLRGVIGRFGIAA